MWWERWLWWSKGDVTWRMAAARDFCKMDPQHTQETAENLLQLTKMVDKSAYYGATRESFIQFSVILSLLIFLLSCGLSK